MKSYCFAVITTLSCLLPSISVAEPLQSLTLDQAIRTAVTNNPQVKAARARLGVSEAEIVTAGARLNPSLLSDNGIAEKTYRLGLEQTIELGGKRHRRVALARAQRDALLADVSTQLLDLRTDVRRAYTQLYSAQERQRVYENILKVSQELVEIAQKREKAGDISKLDVLQTDIARVNANNELQTAAIELINSQSRLNALLNQPLTSPLSLAPPNTAPQLAGVAEAIPITPQQGPVLKGSVNQVEADLESLILEALTRRPEIRQNLHQLEVARFQTDLARANRIPNLTLAVGPDLVLEGGNNEFNAFIVGNLELPLFNRQQGAIAEAAARRNQREQEQAVLKNRIQLEVTSAYTSFKGNQERIQRYEAQLLPYAVAVVDKSRQAFQEGKTSILTPILAQHAYMNTRLGYMQALIDFQNSISDLERAVGAGL